MFEADALSERIAVINHGRIIALDTPGGLKSQVRDLNVVEVEMFGLPAEMLAGLRALPFVDALSVEETRAAADADDPDGARCRGRARMCCAALGGLKIGRVVVREPTLEDAYVRLVGGAGMNFRTLRQLLAHRPRRRRDEPAHGPHRNRS